LTWDDIDWERNRITVRASKTDERVIPLFPELLTYLRECFEYAEPGSTYVITTYRTKEINLRTKLQDHSTCWPRSMGAAFSQHASVT
jgi:integrase